LDARDLEEVAEQIPPPMIPDNWPTVSDRCFVAEHLQKVGWYRVIIITTPPQAGLKHDVKVWKTGTLH
jgi:hypothetical protein